MIIGGLQKFSLLDYPGHLSSIIFTQGCNFRCGFCYNPMLVLPKNRNKKDHSHISEDDLFGFLKSRAGKLDGIVITGGEPTMHKDLPEFISKIKDLGFKIKLDTNGTNPEMLKKLTSPRPSPRTGEGKSLVDYIAMDLKAPIEKYKKVTKNATHLEKVKKSIKIIIGSKLLYEFRTTVVPTLLEKDDISEMGKMIKGARMWYLQQFKPDTDLIDKKLQKIKPYSDKELKEMARIARKYVKRCVVR